MFIIPSFVDYVIYIYIFRMYAFEFHLEKLAFVLVQIYVN